MSNRCAHCISVDKLSVGDLWGIILLFVGIIPTLIYSAVVVGLYMSNNNYLIAAFALLLIAAISSTVCMVQFIVNISNRDEKEADD